MAKANKGKSFNIGDLVFAKVRGYSPWPAQITHGVNKRKDYTVYFYGTGQIGHVKLRNLWMYSQHKEKFLAPKKQRREEFLKSLIEINGAVKGKDWQTTSNYNYMDYDFDKQAPKSDSVADPDQETETADDLSSIHSNDKENQNEVLENMPTAIDMSYIEPQECENAPTEQSSEIYPISEPAPKETVAQEQKKPYFTAQDWIDVCEEVCQIKKTEISEVPHLTK